MAPIRVVLVDDQELLRTGLRMVLESQADLKVVGEAGDGEECLKQLRATEADVVVMDVRMPIMDGIEATRRICAGQVLGAPKVLVLTTFDEEEDAFAALRAGASGYLLKDVPPQDLLAAVRIVAAGEAIVAPQITRKLLDRFAPRFIAAAPAVGDQLTALTDREHQVVLLIAQGLSNAEIGAELGMAEATSKSHVRNILAKLQLRDRVQLVVLAYETGLIRPSGAPDGVRP